MATKWWQFSGGISDLCTRQPPFLTECKVEAAVTMPLKMEPYKSHAIPSALLYGLHQSVIHGLCGRALHKVTNASREPSRGAILEAPMHFKYHGV